MLGERPGRARLAAAAAGFVGVLILLRPGSSVLHPAALLLFVTAITNAFYGMLTRKLGAIKTSMLQDVEASRAVEIDVLLAAPREIGQALSMPTPYMDSLLGLARLQARTLGLYPG